MKCPIQSHSSLETAAPPVPTARTTATEGLAPTTGWATRRSLPWPVPPPKPVRPLFSWKQIGTYLLSERTLNGLLGIGAFLILAAAFAISTVNPTGLSALPHLGMMVATTAVFYVSGFLLRRKLDLTRTGAALLGIGAAFIPLDALTLGRDILQLDWATNWLVASTLCLPLYLLSHLMSRGRPFALLTTISGGSLVLAAGNQLGVPSPWVCAALSLVAIGYLLLGHHVHREWIALAWALFWTAQVTTPLVMAALLAARLLPESVLHGMPIAWHAALLAQRGAALDYAAGTAWWLGTVFYLLAARTSGQRLFRDIAAWVLPCAFVFTLTKAPWDIGWDGFCLVPLVAGYLLYGRFAARLPQGKDGTYRYRDVGREAIFQATLALSLVASAWPFARFTSEIATLASLSLASAAAAFLLRQRAWAYVAVYLVVVIQVRQLTVPRSYVDAAKHLRLDQLSPVLSFAMIAALMLGIGEYLAWRSGEARRPFPETALGLGAWRSLFSGAWFSAGYVGTFLAVWFAFSGGTPLDRLSPTAIAGLLLVTGILAASAGTRRTGILLYPAAGLFLLLCGSLVPQLARHAGTVLTDPALVRCLALVGIGYLALAARLDGPDGRHARPLYLAGYLVGVGTIMASMPDRAINVQLIGLALLSYAWSAWRAHGDRFPSFTRVLGLLPSPANRETLSMLFQYLAIWLFPCWLLLLESLWWHSPTLADYGLVMAGLAPLYLILSLVFGRLRVAYRRPWFLGGCALSALGPLLALGAQDQVVAFLAWSLGAIYYAGAYFHRRAYFNWPLAFMAAVAYVLGVMLTPAYPNHLGAGLLPLVAAYLPGSELLRRRRGAASVRAERRNVRSLAAEWSLPFSLLGHLGAFVVCASAGVSAFSGVSFGESVTIIWLVAALHGGCTALSRHSRWLYPTLAYILAASEVTIILGVPGSTLGTVIVANSALAWLLLTLGHLAGEPRPAAPPWATHPWTSEWVRPLYTATAATWGIALLAATGELLTNPRALQPLALTLAMGGAMCLLAGIRRRRSLYLGLGVTLLACAYVIEMLFLNVTQPQAFTIPVGIAMYVLAYLEWRRGSTPGIKNPLEIVAMLGLLCPALLQAIGQLDAAGTHLVYTALLLLEGTAILAFGAMLRWTKTFFAGGTAIVAAMLILVAEPLRDLSVVYLALLIGCAMIVVVIFLEQRRRRIPLWIDEVRVRLETWS